MKNFLEIQFWKIAKWLIKRGYGANCETSDLDDFHDMYKNTENTKLSENVVHPGRCASCRAKEVIDFIDRHISLLDD